MYPDILWSSEEFGGAKLICSPELYKQEILNCIEDGFSKDFNTSAG
jgi:hypothetical protein